MSESELTVTEALAAVAAELGGVKEDNKVLRHCIDLLHAENIELNTLLVAREAEIKEILLHLEARTGQKAVGIHPKPKDDVLADPLVSMVK
jgi:hypothetical protein